MRISEVNTSLDVLSSVNGGVISLDESSNSAFYNRRLTATEATTSKKMTITSTQ